MKYFLIVEIRSYWQFFLDQLDFKIGLDQWYKFFDFFLFHYIGSLVGPKALIFLGLVSKHPLTKVVIIAIFSFFSFRALNSSKSKPLTIGIFFSFWRSDLEDFTTAVRQPSFWNKLISSCFLYSRTHAPVRTKLGHINKIRRTCIEL